MKTLGTIAVWVLAGFLFAWLFGEFCKVGRGEK